ncbi:MAG: hypothetical protein OXF98_00745 [Rhodospirillaceae bacterium]|nr:hypothetical protein [Rhodospirillaceae bacterium]
MRRWFVRPIFGLVTLWALAPVPVVGQTDTPYEPPRTAEGHPDLQGIWQVLNTAAWDLEDHGASLGVPAGHGVVQGGAIPYQAWALEQKRENFEQRATRDPESRCFLPGVPRITYMPYPFQIIQHADQVVIAYEYLRTVRFIHMNGNPHPPGPIEWWMGDSRGHWEGDTLVVDVIHFNGETWFDRAGNFHSSALHVVERYTPTGPDHLLYEATIEDPEVFTRPWTISMPLYRRQEPDSELLEYQCNAYLLEQEWDNPDSTFFDVP